MNSLQRIGTALLGTPGSWGCRIPPAQRAGTRTRRVARRLTAIVTARYAAWLQARMELDQCWFQ